MSLAARIAAFSLLALTACATGRTDIPMRASATMAPEGHQLWSRPTELGYDMGDEIAGSASSTSILFGLLSFGTEEEGGLLQLFGAATGVPVDDSLVRAASANAVKGKADGLYLTQQDVSKFNFMYLFKTRTAQVRGRALKIKVLGPVTEERADRERMLRAVSGGSTHVEAPASLLQGIVK